jgi:hypothetical protein
MACPLLLHSTCNLQPAHVRSLLVFAAIPARSLLGLQPSFSLPSFMSSEAQTLTWQGQGLPSDALSTQNALAILHGVMTPLVIDPSSQVCMRANMSIWRVPVCGGCAMFAFSVNAALAWPASSATDQRPATRVVACL